MKRLLLCVITILLTINSYAEVVGPWDLNELYTVPAYETTDLVPVDGITSFLYRSLDYLGDTVKVYAYYGVPDGEMPEDGWPAVVYAHGGTGTALYRWVNYWKNKGYACISMDLEGHIPEKVENAYVSSPYPGPSNSGVFDDYENPINEQWYYHATAQIILAHTLIASFPEVDASKIGITGTSWGGTLTSTVMGVDPRWAWAIPVYGAGYLSETDGYMGRELQADELKMAFVDSTYNSALYFDRVNFPSMWVNGTNDDNFSLTCNQKSSQKVTSPTTLIYSLRLRHSNNEAMKLNQMYLFANQVVKAEDALIDFHVPIQVGTFVSAAYTSDLAVDSAKLYYTFDIDSIWPEKYWYDTTAIVGTDSISASIPEGASAAILVAYDSRGAYVTTEYIEISDDTVVTSAQTTGFTSNEQLQAYPNPVITDLIIELPHNDISQYTIFNSSGIIALSGKTKNMRTKVDVSHLPSGVYLVTVNGNTKIIYKIDE